MVDKIDWSSAPSWANFYAVNELGNAHWFEHEPDSELSNFGLVWVIEEGLVADAEIVEHNYHVIGVRPVCKRRITVMDLFWLRRNCGLKCERCSIHCE